MTTAPAGDAATVSVKVDVAPPDAFEVFTREVDLWWRRGPKYRVGGRARGVLHFEAFVGGRLFERFERPGASSTVEMGKVTAWEPPARLAFEWRNTNFTSGQKTLVEVVFESSGEGTLVTVRHAGWAALPAGHPARHGLVGAEFSRMLGMWWGDQMTSLREHTKPSGAARPLTP